MRSLMSTISGVDPNFLQYHLSSFRELGCYISYHAHFNFLIFFPENIFQECNFAVHRILGIFVVQHCKDVMWSLACVGCHVVTVALLTVVPHL